MKIWNNFRFVRPRSITGGLKMRYSLSAPSHSTIPLFQVDSFSNVPFHGNPAAVCLLGETEFGEWPLSDATMLNIAAENNLSETAFLLPTLSSSSTKPFETDRHFRLRWFTPTKEVDLCGHATMATAAVLFQACQNSNPSLHFATRSGELVALQLPDSSKIDIELPLNPPDLLLQPSNSINEMIDHVFGASNKHVVKNILYNATTKKLVFELDDAIVNRDFLEGINISSPGLLGVEQKDLANNNVTGIIVTLLDNTQKYDFLSRYFAPWNGIDEDPVTGSAHTVIAPMWAQRIPGKDSFFARQCSPRGGELGLRLDLKNGKVSISGDVCIVSSGILRTK